MKTDKHHFRKVYKSDHLGVADLEEFLEEGRELKFTIRNVVQYILDPRVKGSGVLVAGKVISANVAFFKEDIKPMVLNATNAKQIKLFTGKVMVEDWNDVRVELYFDESVKMKGEVVGGVRIRKIQPQDKPKPLFTEANFEAATKVNATIELIKSRYSLTPAMEQKYLEYGISAAATA